MPDNLIWRVELNYLPPDIENYRCNCGYFMEFSAKKLTDISNIISEKTKTFASYGIPTDELEEIIRKKTKKKMVNIVPIGKTSDFSLTWDGYNLIDTLSKNK
jgi:hypothetical protein